MKDEAIDDIQTDGLDVDKMTNEEVDKGIKEGFGEKEKETPAESSPEEKTPVLLSAEVSDKEPGNPDGIINTLILYNTLKRHVNFKN